LHEFASASNSKPGQYATNFGWTLNSHRHSETGSEDAEKIEFVNQRVVYLGRYGVVFGKEVQDDGKLGSSLGNSNTRPAGGK